MDKNRCLPCCVIEIVKPTATMKKVMFGAGES